MGRARAWLLVPASLLAALLVVGLRGGWFEREPGLQLVSAGWWVPVKILREEETSIPYPSTRYGDALFVVFEGPGGSWDLSDESFHVVHDDGAEDALEGFMLSSQPLRAICMVPSDYAPGTRKLRIAARRGDSTTIVDIVHPPPIEEAPAASSPAPAPIAPGVSLTGSAHYRPATADRPPNYEVTIGLEAPQEARDRYVLGKIGAYRPYGPRGCERKESWTALSHVGKLTLIDDSPFARDYRRLAYWVNVDRYRFEGEPVVIPKRLIDEMLAGSIVPLEQRSVKAASGATHILEEVTRIKGTPMISLRLTVVGWKGADILAIRSKGCVSNYTPETDQGGLTLNERPSADVELIIEGGRLLSSKTVLLPIRIGKRP